MPSTRIIRRIRHDANDLFEIVADVENYPEFIDLISALRITKKLSDHEFEAEAIVAYKMIRESFLSHVTIDREALKISVKKAEKGGAVKSLLNEWVFHPIEDGSTIVDVVVDVRLKAMPLEFLLREKFGKAAVHIINLFETRAGKTLKHIGEKNYDTANELKRLGLKSEGIV